MKGTNDLCPLTTESCSFYKSEKGAKEVAPEGYDLQLPDKFAYGCILTKYCDTVANLTNPAVGDEKEVIFDTYFMCPYGLKDRVHAEAAL